MIGRLEVVALATRSAQVDGLLSSAKPPAQRPFFRGGNSQITRFLTMKFPMLVAQFSGKFLMVGHTLSY